ncbi:MAG: hypothetical protein IPN97_16335 [Saprospiraceae bacterium]|nr:hypothetical protein [Saprospiraceae bacterium]
MNPNPNAEFTFNDNSNNNQHETLKNLSDHLATKGISPKSVMYAFPRITTLSQFENLEEDLILHTTFLTINEIEDEAKQAGVNLNDRNIHHFRTCYIDENRREIASKIFQLKNSGTYENVLYEIILVKLAHFRNQFPKGVNGKILNAEIFLILAEYLKVNPFNSVRLENYYPPLFNDEIRNYFKRLVEEREIDFYEIFERGNLGRNPFAWRERLFNRVVKFFVSINNDKINIKSDIPSEYTFNLNDEKEYTFDLKTEFDISMLIF